MQPNPDKQKKIEFGIAEQHLRLAVGLRQSDVGAYAGLSSVAITNLESTSPNLSMGSIKRVAALYDCNPQADPADVMKMKLQKLQRLRQEGKVKPLEDLVGLPPEARRQQHVKTAKLLGCDTVVKFLDTIPLPSGIRGGRQPAKKMPETPAPASAKVRAKGPAIPDMYSQLALAGEASRPPAAPPAAEKPAVFSETEAAGLGQWSALAQASKSSGEWRYDPNEDIMPAAKEEPKPWGKKVTASAASKPKKTR